MVRKKKTQTKSLEKNVVQKDPFDLEGIEQKIKEKTNLVNQMQSALQQLQGQLILLQEMKNDRLRKKMQTKG